MRLGWLSWGGIHNVKSYDGRWSDLATRPPETGTLPSLALICYRKVAWLADLRPRIARHRPRSGCVPGEAGKGGVGQDACSNEGSAGGLAKSALAVAPLSSTQLGSA
jgi:hypothetical protein